MNGKKTLVSINKCTDCGIDFRVLQGTKRKQFDRCHACHAAHLFRLNHRKIPLDLNCVNCGESFSTLGRKKHVDHCRRCSYALSRIAEFSKVLGDRKNNRK